MKLTFKEFIESWYDFLKKETWVIKGFIIVVLLLSVAGYHLYGIIMHTSNLHRMHIRLSIVMTT